MRSMSSQKRILGCLTAGLLFFSPVSSQNGYVFRDGKTKASVKTAAVLQKDTNADRQTLFNVLKELNKTKGVYFLFSDQFLGDRLVNKVSDTKKGIENILEEVLKGSGLKFKRVNDKTFVIVPANEKSRAGNEYLPVNFIRVEAENGLKTIEAVVADIVKGRVRSEDGSPVANVSVTLRGSTKGTSTNAAGEFSIEADRTDVLVFSSVGYITQEIPVGDRSDISITLMVSNMQLNEVVVTALGIQRQSKSLSYSVQKLNNEDLTNVKDPNFINNLRGRVAGVTVNQSSSGVGGSTRIVLRGNKSTRENQPLYVVDGIPLSNYSPAQPGGLFGQAAGSGSAGLDGGDGISNVNPDDVESVTVLKGASAAALYGSQAANGVILITTKKGKAGNTHINFSSELTFEKPLYKTPLQFKYGQTTPATDSTAGSDESWGNVVNAPDHVSPFFQTGVTKVNSLSLMGGTDRSQSYFSYAYTDNKGILPNSYLYRHNITFRQTAKFLNDKLTVDANISFMNQRSNNRIAGGYYGNPLIGLYEFPRGINFNTYKNYTYFSPLRNVALQNWWNLNYDKGYAGNEYEQNPYWLMKRNTNTAERNRGYAIFSVKYNINDWLDVQARGNIDKSLDDLDSRYYAGTQTILAPANGRYFFQRVITTQLYGDLILNLHKKLSNLMMFTANIGGIFTDTKSDLQNFDTDYTNADGGLRIANKFTLQNILPAALNIGETYSRRVVHAAFASAQLSLKNNLFLDLTARNDWSSTLAYTPTKNKGYFYYSAGLTAVVSEMVPLPDPVTFAKFRISYAKVGNDVAAYSTNPQLFNINFQQGIQNFGKAPLPGVYLQPEDNRSFEAGTEWRFLQDRVGFDLTYYVNNNYNQYLETKAPTGSGLSFYYFPGGNIRNNGIELSVNIVPVRTTKLTWNSTINYAFNKNKIIKIARPDIKQLTDQFILTGIGNENYESRIKQGGSWGDIYGYLFARAADGSILVGDDGAPKKAQTTVGSDSIGFIGNSNARYSIGWNNSFQFGRFNLSFLLDGRFGGKVMSNTQALLDQGGYSKASADARDAGGVAINATKASGGKFSGPLPAKIFYETAGGRAGISEFYMYDATNIRLRELSLGYNIAENIKWISSIRLAFVARNLFIVSKKAPFDPEVSLSTGNGVQGIDAFGLPTTRSLGVSLKVGF